MTTYLLTITHDLESEPVLSQSFDLLAPAISAAYGDAMTRANKFDSIGVDTSANAFRNAATHIAHWETHTLTEGSSLRYGVGMFGYRITATREAHELVLTHEGRELSLHIDNTRAYHEGVLAVNARMARLWVKGEFDLDKGIAAYAYVVRDAARDYMRTFGTTGNGIRDVFPKACREQVQEFYARTFVTLVRGNPDVWGDLGDKAAKALADYRATLTDEQWDAYRKMASLRRGEGVS